MISSSKEIISWFCFSPSPSLMKHNPEIEGWKDENVNSMSPWLTDGKVPSTRSNEGFRKRYDANPQMDPSISNFCKIFIISPPLFFIKFDPNINQSE